MLVWQNRKGPLRIIDGQKIPQPITRRQVVVLLKDAMCGSRIKRYTMKYIRSYLYGRRQGIEKIDSGSGERPFGNLLSIELLPHYKS